MRPIKRGDQPAVADDLLKKQDWRTAYYAPLIKKLGDYCSYCEIRLPMGLQVEHVQPKNKNARPGLVMTWDNLLLACDYCNPNKGHKTIILTHFYWPDQDNTARAFVYSDSKIGVAQEETSASAKPVNGIIAQATIDLTGLDHIHDKKGKEDPRPKSRHKVWRHAWYAFLELQKNDSQRARRWVVRHATCLGHWSIWRAVFCQDTDADRRKDMLERLNNAFLGTDKDCFNSNFDLIPRFDGQI